MYGNAGGQSVMALRGNNVLSRRGALSGLAMIGGVMASGLAAPVPSGSPAVREDIARLARSPHRLARLEAAIGEMRRRSRIDPDDPAGWDAHARTHTQVCAKVANADDAQVHGCWWFLPWHRAFLAVTEWKLRALSGDPTLALPYWNWSSDRRVPAAFARERSALAHAARHTPDRGLRAAEVDGLGSLAVAALGARSFVARVPEHIPTSFGGMAKPNPAGWHGRSRMETIPHNAVHNYVGGEAADGMLGDMTELATAALDPLFYAHHGNLDRLWEVWRQDPARKATEPAEPAFTDHRFLFPWIDGSVVAVSVADTLDTRRLGYRYDSLTVLRDGTVPERDSAPHGVALATAALGVPAGQGRCTLRISGVVPGDRPLTVEIALARPGDPGSAVSVGAYAMGRLHSAPTFPDTEPCFDVTDVVGRLGSPAVVVSVLPLALGPASLGWPAFRYAGMTLER